MSGRLRSRHAEHRQKRTAQRKVHRVAVSIETLLLLLTVYLREAFFRSGGGEFTIAESGGTRGLRITTRCRISEGNSIPLPILLIGNLSLLPRRRS